MGNTENGEFSPSDWAHAYFERNGSELTETAKELFDSYRLEHGEFIVTLQYAPDNEATRVYYIVTMKGREVMRCQEISAVTSFFSVLDEVSELRDLVDEDTLGDYQVVLAHCENLENQLVLAEEKATMVEKELCTAIERCTELESELKAALKNGKISLLAKLFG